MFATGQIVGLGEWIIDDKPVLYCFIFLMDVRTFGNTKCVKIVIQKCLVDQLVHP